MSREYCPICAAPLPERLHDPTEPQACEHAEGEWWDYATWGCQTCIIRFNVNEMYEYGGECPFCKGTPKLISLYSKIPF